MKSIFLPMVEEHQKGGLGDSNLNGLGVLVVI